MKNYRLEIVFLILLIAHAVFSLNLLPRIDFKTEISEVEQELSAGDISLQEADNRVISLSQRYAFLGDAAIVSRKAVLETKEEQPDKQPGSNSSTQKAAAKEPNNKDAKHKMILLQQSVFGAAFEKTLISSFQVNSAKQDQTAKAFFDETTTEDEVVALTYTRISKSEGANFELLWDDAEYSLYEIKEPDEEDFEFEKKYGVEYKIPLLQYFQTPPEYPAGELYVYLQAFLWTDDAGWVQEATSPSYTFGWISGNNYHIHEELYLPMYDDWWDYAQQPLSDDEILAAMEERKAAEKMETSFPAAQEYPQTVYLISNPDGDAVSIMSLDNYNVHSLSGDDRARPFYKQIIADDALFSLVDNLFSYIVQNSYYSIDWEYNSELKDFKVMELETLEEDWIQYATVFSMQVTFPVHYEYQNSDIPARNGTLTFTSRVTVGTGGWILEAESPKVYFSSDDGQHVIDNLTAAPIYGIWYDPLAYASGEDAVNGVYRSYN